ncbi:MAG: hypothetical protein ACSHXL_01135 [Bacteroidota bacterium]
MMKHSIILFVYLLISALSFAQQNEAKSKAFYFSAQDAFTSQKYDDALSLLEKSEEAGGASNAYIEALKAKCYAGKKDWVKTKQALEVCYSYNPDDDVLKDLSPIILRADTEYEKAIKAEKDRLEAERNRQLAEQQAEMIEMRNIQQNELKKIEEKQKIEQLKQKEWNEKANAYKPDALAFLESFKKLKEGYPYLLKSRSVTDMSTEKAYFIFYGDKYLIYYIPKMEIAQSLFKDNISTVFQDSISNAAKIKPTGYGVELVSYINSRGEKVEEYFKGKTSELYNNKGMVLEYNSGTKRKGETFTRRLYYSHLADNIWRNSKSTVNYSKLLNRSNRALFIHPQIETGSIDKEINYKTLADEDLIAEFESYGFKQSLNKIYPTEVLNISRESLSVLVPVKEVTYKLVDENAEIIGYRKRNRQRYFYEEVEHTMTYGWQYYEGFEYGNSFENNLTDNIVGVNNQYKMDKDTFISIFSDLNTPNDKYNDFNFGIYDNPDEKEIFELIILLDDKINTDF